MKKSSLRAFGIACFLIGALITVSDKVKIPLITSDKAENVNQYKEKISQLEKQLEEANNQISSLEQNKIQPENTNEEITTEVQSQAEATDQDANSSVVTDTLYVYSGLTPADVAQKLKDLGIINNSVEMELFLAQPEYATSIQKGQFKLNSSMTIEEIANIITGKTNEE